jgi:hypothetical protein
MQRTGFWQWAGTSLVGHLALYQMAFAVPIAATFLYLNYSDGTLTATWAVRIVVVSCVVGALVAASIWYTITSPLLKRRGRNLER